MGRHPQKLGEKGSLKWIQKLINNKSDLLDYEVTNAFSLKTLEEIESAGGSSSDEVA